MSIPIKIGDKFYSQEYLEAAVRYAESIVMYEEGNESSYLEWTNARKGFLIIRENEAKDE